MARRVEYRVTTYVDGKVWDVAVAYTRPGYAWALACYIARRGRYRFEGEVSFVGSTVVYDA